jgi:hypothetical protein
MGLVASHTEERIKIEWILACRGKMVILICFKREEGKTMLRCQNCASQKTNLFLEEFHQNYVWFLAALISTVLPTESAWQRFAVAL